MLFQAFFRVEVSGDKENILKKNYLNVPILKPSGNFQFT